MNKEDQSVNNYRASEYVMILLINQTQDQVTVLVTLVLVQQMIEGVTLIQKTLQNQYQPMKK
jgi:hypothetical protein